MKSKGTCRSGEEDKKCTSHIHTSASLPLYPHTPSLTTYPHTLTTHPHTCAEISRFLCLASSSPTTLTLFTFDFSRITWIMSPRLPITLPEVCVCVCVEEVNVTCAQEGIIYCAQPARFLGMRTVSFAYCSLSLALAKASCV